MASVEAEKPEGLVLFNANVITLDPSLPRAESIEMEGTRIRSVGNAVSSSSRARAIDCQGKTVIPGLIDAHTHFLAYASSLQSVDCSPGAVNSIEGVINALSKRADEMPPGKWIKGTGYEEFYLQENRHPTSEDIDQASTSHPVRLIHRSRHASVLNSYAMKLANVTIETPEPYSGVIDRHPETGQPTGFFLDLEQWLDERLEGADVDSDVDGTVHEASQRYLSMGITTFQDASPSNSLGRWRLFQRLKREGKLGCRLSMMVGYENLQEMIDAGLKFRSGDEWLVVGPAKVMLSQVAGSLNPSKEELIEIFQVASELGFPLAVHAVEKEEVEATVEALETHARQNPDSILTHRIEHCSVAPPQLQDRLAKLNAMVVTQPGFLYHSGERYLRQVAEEDVQWLYPVKSLREKGICIAASSDAPVAPPHPMTAIYSAVTRRSASGETVVTEEGISTLEALKMYTVDASYALGEEAVKGTISEGKLADLAILSDDPTRVSPESIKEIRVEATIIGGRVVWASDGYKDRIEGS